MSDEHTDDRTYRPTRRIVFTSVASLGVAAALAGCGAGSGSGGSSSAATDESGATVASPTAKAGAELAATSEVPVGGGVILTDMGIVVTQPTKGTFKAFSSTCTHQGFTVTSVADGVIDCNHHGSEYSAATGAVKRGPAQAALTEVAVKVSGTSVVAA